MSSAAAVAIDDAPDSYYSWLARQGALAFSRIAHRRAKLKRRLDCGHVIDGSEPYRYQVWKGNGDAGLTQRTDCEFCARGDSRY